MVWEFSELVGRRLVLWALLNVPVGLALWLGIGSPAGTAPDPFLRGFGLQALVWGAIDGAIGLVGILGARRDRRRGAGDPDAPAAAARRLRRLLLLNAGLDVGYVVAGLAVVFAVAGSDPFLQGSGWGVVLQGAFLFVFDLLHARWIPSPEPFLPPGVKLFAGPEHEPFTFEPGHGREPGSASAPGADAPDRPAGDVSDRSAPPLALLVHGFGGTPAEMRPLGAALAAAGWRVHAPLLPGMGAGIRDLTEMRAADWEAAVEAGARRLAGAGERPVLAVGYSLGAALALSVAERRPFAGLVLLAPFWWPSPLWSRIAGPLLRTVLPPGIRPFKALDLDAPDVRRGMADFLPGLDLDDPAVRTALRDARIPVGMFGELLELSRRVRRAAGRVRGPVLVVQGSRDEVVRPERTALLAAGFREPPSLVEVAAGHDLVGPKAAGAGLVLEPVLAFASSLATAGPVPADASAGTAAAAEPPPSGLAA